MLCFNMCKLHVNTATECYWYTLAHILVHTISTSKHANIKNQHTCTKHKHDSHYKILQL